MSSNIKADRNRIWQNSANWKYSPSQLREIDFRLHLVLLALEAIANLSSETIVIAAEELNVASIIKDRLTLWKSSFNKHDADKSIDAESTKSLILVIFYLSNQHQELLRRSICLLEQVWEQDRSPNETTLLNSYKNRFINLYQTRIDLGCKSDAKLAHLAWKLAIALLFYSGKNGRSLLANAILDLVPTPFEYPATKVSGKRRFTPPTCTLEIIPSNSLLHLIKSKNKLEFELTFDDPREPTSDRSVIRGDEQDLQKLETEITRYAGQYLTSTFQLTENITEPESSKLSEERPHLKKRLVNHELCFGYLTHDNLDRTIVSTIQLFDLMTALEAFKTQATQSNRTPLPKFVLWGGIAAVAIATVGVAKIVSRPVSQPNIAAPEPSSPPQKSQSDEVLPPDLPQAIAKPDLNPKPNEPLTSAKRLPPPPAVDTPKPKPDIPDPADYPLPDVARQSGLNNAAPSIATDRQTESTVVIPKKTQQTNPNQVPVTTAIEPTVNPESLELNTEPNNASEPSPEEDRRSPSKASSDAALNSSPTSTQIEQVTAYFQEQWQPPAELKQSLEYRLSLNGDGSIARVSPLGKASALYLDRTNIPLDGKPFIAATESQPAIIRLLLSPDGRVQTFVE